MKRLLAISLIIPVLPAAMQAADVPVQPVEDSPAAAPAMAPALAAGEERIREGIMLLVQLHDTLAKVQDKDTAEAAVAPVMRLMGKLEDWGHSFNALPPLDDDTRDRYERRYLPVIQKLNDRIQAQGERLASAEFYGSRNLPAALVRLVANFQ